MEMEISEKKCTLVRTHTDYEIFVHFLDSQEVNAYGHVVPTNSVSLISLPRKPKTKGHVYKE